MKPWRARIIIAMAAGIAFAPRLAAAQTAPPPAYPQPQGGYVQQQVYPPQQGAPGPGGAAPQGYAQPQGGASQQQGYPQQGYPQQPQGNKARGYPQGYYPQQGGDLQQSPSYGAQVPGQAAAAQGAPPNDAGATPDADLGHHGQMNFRADFLTGYRMLYRYDSSPRCAPYDTSKKSNDQQKFCGYGAAPAIGMAFGFSLVDFFEPFAFVRLGLANEAAETNQGKMLQVGAGARLYTMASSRFKVFFSPWLGIDTTSGPYEAIGSGTPGSPGYDDALAKVKPGSYKTDLLAHFDLGPQYDFSRAFGMYLSGGLTFQMVRYFGATADLSFGIQARAP